LMLHFQDEWIQAGTELTVPIFTGESLGMSGWQLALEADPDAFELQRIEGLAPNTYRIQPESGTVRIAWLDQQMGLSRTFERDSALFTLHLRAKKDLRLSQSLRLRRDLMKSEATDASVWRREMILQFLDDSSPATGPTQVYAPVPNPTSGLTRWGIQMEAAGSIQLRLLDQTGRLVHTQAWLADTGFQSIELMADQLPASGLYFWQIEAGGQRFHGKLVRQ
jgi:hypothetical protein